MNRWAKALIWFCLSGVAAFAAVAAFVVTVDPYNLTPLVTRAYLNAELPALMFQSRLTKAVGIIRKRPDIILLGTSVVDRGFEIPGSTNYDAHRLRNMATSPAERDSGAVIYNAGIRGGTTGDALNYLEHAYLNNPQLRQVVVGFEWMTFTDLIDLLREWTPPSIDSALLGHTALFPYAYKKYLTWTALDDAVRTIQASRGEAAEGLAGALSLRKVASWLVRHPEVFGNESTSTGGGTLPVSVTLHADLIAQARNEQESRALFFAVHTADILWAVLGRSGRPGLARPYALANVKRIVDFAKVKNLQLVFYASPQPPIYWAVINRAGLWPYYLDWLRQLALITPFYDLSAMPVVFEDIEHNFLDDPVHFGPALGAQLLPILLRTDPLDQPDRAYVTRENVEAHLDRRTRQLDEWLAQDSYAAGLVTRVVIEPSMSISRPRLNQLLPTPFEPAPAGFRVVRLFGKEFYGLPAGEEPFDLLKVVKREYHPMVVGESAAEVVATIEREGLKAWNPVPVDLSGGMPIASGGSPDKAFGGDGSSYWIAPEHGREVEGHAWVGYAFGYPTSVRRVRFTQPRNPAFRQGAVMVQASRDDGVTWIDVLARPAHLYLGAEASTIPVPAMPPADRWRIVARGDSAEAAAEGWAIQRLEFFVPDFAVRPFRLVPVDWRGGAFISSEGPWTPPMGDGLWRSAERGPALTGPAWLGYRFHAPVEVRQILLVQRPGKGARPDFVLVQKSPDGGSTWTNVLPGAHRVGDDVSLIGLPEDTPATAWRLVAAGNSGTGTMDVWEPVDLQFLVAEPLPARDRVDRVAASEGAPIASGGSPEKAFDGDPETFWISPERGTAVKDRAWIGLAFNEAREICRIEVSQTWNHPYRQDWVRVEASRDGGVSWEDAVGRPVRLASDTAAIELPAAPPATQWRLVAAGQNATAPEAAWAPLEISFYKCSSAQEVSATSSGASPGSKR